LQDEGRIILIEQPENLGFIAAVNRALVDALKFGDHVVLLNSDAFVPQGWASRLLRPILTGKDVASVTPMSNDAEIFGAPAICQPTVLFPGEADALDRHAARFHPVAALTEAPTGVGFCMAMNIGFLAQVPQLDTIFGRGYGEEVDWCQRVRALGGRHMGTAGLFVEHRGGVSFGSVEKLQLVQTNNAIIARRYPGYDAEVQQFIRNDPMVTARLALAIAWAAARQPTGQRMPIFLAHSLGGGSEDYLQRRIADTIGDAGDGRGSAVVLRVGGPHRWQVELYSSAGIVTGLTDDTALLHRLLESITARHVIYSCGVGDHDPVGLPDVLRALADGPAHRL
jgi:GT2 family glycosyltransferase